jgi:Ca2+-binding RTX toxin-like protein
MAARTVLLALAVMAVAPGAADAASVAVANGELNYRAGAGERNVLEVRVTNDGSEYSVWDAAAAYGKHRATLTAGTGCRLDAKDPGQAYCTTAGVQRIAVSLRDRADSLSTYDDLHAPVTYSGGAGIDNVSFFATDDKPMAISADGVANDGLFGRDDVRPDVENLYGGSFADRLTASARGGGLIGGEGDDTMTGGPGNDRFYAAYVETVGLQSGDFFYLGTDTIGCGGGHDVVLADPTDQVARDCEVVGRADRRPGHGYVFRGSNGADRIQPPYFWDPGVVHGRGGDDLLLTPGDYGSFKLYGGSGHDRIQSGNGVDLLDGGPGNDVLRANGDAVKDHHDTLRCGPGFDRAYVDRGDRVARDCERVLVVR